MHEITVAVVDDDARVAAHLRRLLDSGEGLGCVAACPSAEVACQELPGLAPRVVLMDVQLPGASGVECVRRLKPVMPASDFIMLTVIDDYETVYESLLVGATGYLLKGAASDEVRGAVREVALGGSPMSGVIARKVVAAFREFVPSPAGTGLTQRETKVLEALATGAQYKEVAEELGLTYHTVRTHVQNIYKKLHVHSRGAAVRHLQGGRSHPPPKPPPPAPRPT